MNVVDKVVNNSFDGIDLNFEDGEVSGQTAFAIWVKKLADALHAKGKELSVTLKPDEVRHYIQHTHAYSHTHKHASTHAFCQFTHRFNP